MHIVGLDADWQLLCLCSMVQMAWPCSAPPIKVCPRACSSFQWLIDSHIFQNKEIPACNRASKHTDALGATLGPVSTPTLTTFFMRQSLSGRVLSPISCPIRHFLSHSLHHHTSCWLLALPPCLFLSPVGRKMEQRGVSQKYLLGPGRLLRKSYILWSH